MWVYKSSKTRESIRTILELCESKANSTLVVTGCLMRRYKDELIKELQVDLFSGVGDYDKIDEIIEKKQSLFSSKTYLQKSEKKSYNRLKFPRLYQNF